MTDMDCIRCPFIIWSLSKAASNESWYIFDKFESRGWQFWQDWLGGTAKMIFSNLYNKLFETLLKGRQWFPFFPSNLNRMLRSFIRSDCKYFLSNSFLKLVLGASINSSYRFWNYFNRRGIRIPQIFGPSVFHQLPVAKNVSWSGIVCKWTVNWYLNNIHVYPFDHGKIQILAPSEGIDKTI